MSEKTMSKVDAVVSSLAKRQESRKDWEWMVFQPIYRAATSGWVPSAPAKLLRCSDS